jgi:adenylate kinase family enzyme
MKCVQYRRINIVGAPGSGTTTLGRALSARIGYHFADADSFYWKASVPPFREKYDPDIRLARLLAELAASQASIVAGSVCGWGEELESSFDLAIFLSLPTELRLKRIVAREMSLFGRADPAFLEWAAQYDEGRLPGRSRARHEAWLESRQCRVLRFEGDQDIDDRVREIVEVTAAGAFGLRGIGSPGEQDMP